MRIARTSFPLVLLALTAGTAIAQDGPGYPIEEFLGVTSFSEIAVSPDGRYIAVVSAADDFDENKRNSAIWRIDLDERGRKTGQIRLASSDGSYSRLRWSADSRQLVFLYRARGSTPQLHVIDMRGGEARRLTDPELYSEGIAVYDWLGGTGELVFAAPAPRPKEEKEALEAFYGDAMRFADEPQYTTIERLGLAVESGAGTPIATVDLPIGGLSVSPDGVEIALVSAAPAKPQRFFNDFAEREIFLLPTDGGGGLRQLTRNFVSEAELQWRPDGEAMYAAGLGDPDEERGRWTQGRLFSVALDGRVETLAPGFVGSFSAPYVQLADGSLLSSAVVSTRANIYRVEPEKGEVERLTDFRGAVSNISASTDGGVIAFSLISYRAAPEIYVARGVKNLADAEAVTEFNADFNLRPMPEIEAISWSNGEGDEIEGILFWPPGRRGAMELPLVVDIHGGPWSVRTENIGPIGFAYYPALLASRGYLVLEANYRGGTGRGDEFLHAIEGYSCTRPATDVLRGVDHLIERGWADPTRMAVMGYSYGGLMTNCIIGLTDRFVAAASGAGIWNDISYFGTADNFLQNDVRNLGAAPWENLENYWEESAISRAGNITTPTLITIGGADRRVPTTQGYELYRALVRLGVPTELIVFPGEPHGFRQPKHKLTKVKAELRWIEKYLKGSDPTGLE